MIPLAIACQTFGADPYQRGCAILRTFRIANSVSFYQTIVAFTQYSRQAIALAFKGNQTLSAAFQLLGERAEAIRKRDTFVLRCAVRRLMRCGSGVATFRCTFRLEAGQSAFGMIAGHFPKES